MGLSSQIRRLGRLLPLHVSAWRPRPKWIGETDRFAYQQLFADFDIRPEETVLDIGSGGYPFPYATVLMDQFPDASPHRAEALVRDHRPFLQADLHALPFADASFDFVYCSHVLEHTQDPIQACGELMRIARRGFVETPNYGKDVLFGWSEGQHLWHVVGIADSLVFFEYSKEQVRGVRSTVWRDLVLSPIYHPIQNLFYENQNFFNTMFEWRRPFRVVEFRLNGSVRTLDP